MIRLRAGLLDQPNLVNHVIIVHHQQKNGDWIGLEGKPGGVGWINLTQRRVLKSPYVLANNEQPKTEDQRFLIAKASEKLLGVQYDWVGIAQEAFAWGPAVRIFGFMNNKWGNRDNPPEHVFCSNYADWVYDSVGAWSPGALFDRSITPNDWAKFIIEKGWKLK
jgi:hypothetical protein